MEGQEQRGGPSSGAASGYLDGAAPGFDAYQITISDVEASGVRWRQLHPRLRRRGIQLRRPAGLGPGMKVVDASAGHQLHRVRVVRALCRWYPLGALEPGAAVKARGSMVGGHHDTPPAWRGASRFSG